jgi:hypothetical protein
VQLDDSWYAQGSAWLFRMASPDNDPAKLSAPVLGLMFEPAFMPQLLKARTLVFWDDRVEQERFDIAALDRSSLDTWAKCAKALPREPWSTIPIASQYRLQMPLQPASPVNRKSWFRADDYPARAMREEQEGVVGFTVAVGVNGRVNDCNRTAHDSSTTQPTADTFQYLVDATCRTVKRRARFIPATDGTGRPFASSWAGRVRWQIPYD